MPSGDFFERNEAKLCSPINMAPRPLSKPPVGFFTRRRGPPHIFIRKSHQRPRKILISGGKRLFQQHRSCPAQKAVSGLSLLLIPEQSYRDPASLTLRARNRSRACSRTDYF